MHANDKQLQINTVSTFPLASVSPLLAAGAALLHLKARSFLITLITVSRADTDAN